MPSDAAGKFAALNDDVNAFRHYLQGERGLAHNTILAYGRDLNRFMAWVAGGALDDYLTPTVRDLSRYQATVVGELDDIVAGLKSLDGRMVRRAGSRGVLHLHIALGEFDTTDAQTADAYDAICDDFLRPHRLDRGGSGVPL